MIGISSNELFDPAHRQEALKVLDMLTTRPSAISETR